MMPPPADSRAQVTTLDVAETKNVVNLFTSLVGNARV